jgi:hypothetical protein
MANRGMKVGITADNKDLKRKLGDSEKQVGKFSATVKKAGVALAGAFAASAVIGGLKSMITELTNAADRLLDLEQITGLSTDRLQEYEHVARIAGANSETMANAVQTLTRRMARATGEGGRLNDALNQLGISTEDSAGSLRNSGEVMEEVIGKLTEVENITERNILGAQVFGGEWKDLALILSMGADGIEKARDEAHRLGLVMGKDALNEANKLSVELEMLNTQWVAMKRDITIAALPALQNMMDGFEGLAVIIKSEAMPWYEKFWKFVNGQAGQIFAAEVVKDWEDNLNEVDKIGLEICRTQDNINKLLETYKEKHNPVIEARQKLEWLQIEYLNALEREKIATEQAATEAAAAAEEKRLAELQRIQEIAAAEEKAEAERREALGTIGRLNEDIQETQARLIAANSDAERVRHAARLKHLEEEKEKILEIAGAQISPMKAAGAKPIETAVGKDPMQERATTHVDLVQQMINAEKKLDEQQQQTAENAIQNMALMVASGNAAASDIIKQAIAMATAHLISSIMTTVTFPANLALAMAAGAMVGGIQSAIPTFADGGIVSGPTLGIMGEYAGARSNPEIIAPLDELKKHMGGEMQVTGRIMGNNIWLTNERFGRRKNLVE